MGPDHIDVADSYTILGEVYRKKSKLDLAKDCFQRALEIQENQSGPNHVDVAKPYNNLSIVYRERDELDLAKICLQRPL